MIFINISKVSIARVLCWILAVLVLVGGILKINQLNKEIKIQKNEIIEIKKEKEKLIAELDECKEWLKNKDDRIIELEEELEGLNMSVPDIGNIKTYMDYTKICKNSKQGKIVYATQAWTDEDGLRRWEDYYCVALGSYYGNVGDKFWIETANGNKYKIIKADEKANKHTDASNRYTVATKCMIEWIVETNKLNYFVKNSGNINNVEKVSGNIVKITKIKE